MNILFYFAWLHLPHLRVFADIELLNSTSGDGAQDDGATPASLSLFWVVPHNLYKKQNWAMRTAKYLVSFWVNILFLGDYFISSITGISAQVQGCGFKNTLAGRGALLCSSGGKLSL